MGVMDDFPVTTSDIALRRELVAEGWTDRDIARAVHGGILTKVRYGAYVATPMVSTLDAVGLMRVRSRAVLRTAHRCSVLSRENALAELDVPLWGVDLDNVHLTRTDGRAGRKEAGVVHHRGRLRPDEWTTRDGIPLVVPARAAVELTTAYPTEVGVVVVSAMLHSGLASISSLHEAARRADRWPNSLNVRTVLARADGRLASVAEARTWNFFHAQRLPRPEPQVVVVDEWGNILGILDFVWREPGVFLEVDGRAKYERHRRPGETLEQYLMREKRREEQICAVTGWVCVRITWADLERPLLLARRLRRLLDCRTTPAA